MGTIESEDNAQQDCPLSNQENQYDRNEASKTDPQPVCTANRKQLMEEFSC